MSITTPQKLFSFTTGPRTPTGPTFENARLFFLHPVFDQLHGFGTKLLDQAVTAISLADLIPRPPSSPRTLPPRPPITSETLLVPYDISASYASGARYDLPLWAVLRNPLSVYADRGQHTRIHDATCEYLTHLSMSSMQEMAKLIPNDTPYAQIHGFAALLIDVFGDPRSKGNTLPERFRSLSAASRQLGSVMLAARQLYARRLKHDSESVPRLVTTPVTSALWDILESLPAYETLEGAGRPIPTHDPRRLLHVLVTGCPDATHEINALRTRIKRIETVRLLEFALAAALIRDSDGAEGSSVLVPTALSQSIGRMPWPFPEVDFFTLSRMLGEIIAHTKSLAEKKGATA